MNTQWILALSMWLGLVYLIVGGLFAEAIVMRKSREASVFVLFFWPVVFIFSIFVAILLWYIALQDEEYLDDDIKNEVKK